MKTNRYDYGFFWLLLPLIVLLYAALKTFPGLPLWVVLLVFSVLVFGAFRWYSVAFLRRICKNNLGAWIDRHGFSVDICGFFPCTAHIQGVVDNRPVRIEILHGSKHQTSVLKCKTNRLVGTYFDIAKKGYPMWNAKPNGSGFEQVFQVNAGTSDIRLNGPVRERLAIIQSSSNLINTLTFELGEVTLFYEGLLTDPERMQAALEAVMLAADVVEPRPASSPL